jgi:hypothetical protein
MGSESVFDRVRDAVVIVVVVVIIVNICALGSTGAM